MTDLIILTTRQEILPVHNYPILDQAIDKKRKLIKYSILVGLATALFITVMIWSIITSVDFHNRIINDAATKRHILRIQVGLGTSLEIMVLFMIPKCIFKRRNPFPLFISYIPQIASTLYISDNYDEFTYIKHELDMFLISNWIFIFIQLNYVTLITWISYKISKI